MKKLGVLALAGMMMLWAATVLADDNPLIGKTYWVRQPSTMFAGLFTKVPLKRGEALTVIEAIPGNDGFDWVIVQRQSGEKVKIRTWIVEDTIQTRQIVSEAPPSPPPMPERPKITYGPGEPEGYKNFKWGMTEDEAREFYNPYGDIGKKLAERIGPDLFPDKTASVQTPFKDSIGPVSVTVSLRFLSEANAPSQQQRDWYPDKTLLSSVYISFQSKDYETLKDIFIERYGETYFFSARAVSKTRGR